MVMITAVATAAVAVALLLTRWTYHLLASPCSIRRLDTSHRLDLLSNSWPPTIKASLTNRLHFITPISARCGPATGFHIYRIIPQAPTPTPFSTKAVAGCLISPVSIRRTKVICQNLLLRIFWSELHRALTNYRLRMDQKKNLPCRMAQLVAFVIFS